MTLHDEITAEMHAYATAETGGLDPLTYLRLCTPRESAPDDGAARRRETYEQKRQAKRSADEDFARRERERWQRANENRRRKIEAARREALTSDALSMSAPPSHRIP